MDILTIALVLIMAAANVACFVIGAKVGQAVTRGKDIELPSANPMKAIQERENRRQAKEEQERVDTIMRNIENYDGTSFGQEDVPRRS